MSAKPRTTPKDLVLSVRLARRPSGPRTAANRAGSSNPAVFFCDIKDLLAVQGVPSEPVSAEFPVKQGKNREFQRIWAI